jgi:hypothetical protein
VKVALAGYLGSSKKKGGTYGLTNVAYVMVDL